MGKKLYLTNLAPSITASGLSDTFSRFGKVEAVRLVVDRKTGKRRGLACVEMASAEEASLAALSLDGKSYNGQMLRVNAMRPMSPELGGALPVSSR